MSRLQLALDQLATTRRYTLRLLDAVEPADWFRMPPGGVSHIGWQVGHLAMAEYRLVLERIRGRRPEDEQLISDDLLTRFRRLSVPEPDPARNPSVADLRAVLDRVHQQAMAELPDLPEAELDQPPVKSNHPWFTTKLGALLWCAQHEMVHAGQIGLLRRQLGGSALW